MNTITVFELLEVCKGCACVITFHALCTSSDAILLYFHAMVLHHACIANGCDCVQNIYSIYNTV